MSALEISLDIGLSGAATMTEFLSNQLKNAVTGTNLNSLLGRMGSAPIGKNGVRSCKITYYENGGKTLKSFK